MIKRIVPVALILTVACGGRDSTGPGPVPCPTSQVSIQPNFDRISSLHSPSAVSAAYGVNDISTMNVGDVRVLEPADIPNGIDLPAGSGARDYVIIVGNTSSAHDVVASYVVKADRSPGAVFNVSPSSNLRVQSNFILDGALPERHPQVAIDKQVRAFERTGLTLRSRRSSPGASGLSASRSAKVSALCALAVGDTLSLKIPNASTTNLCNNFIPTKAVVAAISRRAIIAIDTLDGNYLTVFPAAVLDSIAREFDDVTYPTDSSYFGNPTDVDGNSRIIMLFTGQINKLTPPNTQGGFVGGFFFAGDFFPTTGTQPNTFCPESNLAEIFYLLSPDPTGTKFGNVRTASSVRQGTRGTIAHEFQHMINAGRRFQNPLVSVFESPWLDEALAHLAEDAVGRTQRGFTDLQTLTFNDLLPCNTPCSQANDFNAFFFQNLARLTYWMDRPDLYSPMSSLADTSLATRGAAWAFLRYAADNYSTANPRALTRQVVAGPDTGVKNLTASTKVSVDTLVSGWLVSMFADHLGISGLNARYQYRSYNFQSAMPPVAKSVLNLPTATYPLRVQSVGSGSDNLSATNRSGTGTYYRLSVPAGAGAKNVKILDGSGANASFPGEHIYVLRVQ